MLARDIMTKAVVTVAPHAPLSAVAQALLDARVSAVPVVATDGRPVGVVSELDLIGQHAPERILRRDHWLSRLAEGQTLSPEYLEVVEPNARTAEEIMTTPVITVDEDADLATIAGILAVRKVKRVFVVGDDKLVGVVSRADLARALMLRPKLEPGRAPVEDAPPPPPPPGAAPAAPVEPGFTASAFRRLVEAHEDAKRAARVREIHAHEEARRALVKKLAGERMSDKAWKDLLDRARGAAERGDKDFLLLRFPSALCSDGGRMINAPDPDWPTTLRGPAADVYEHWRDELKPAGFGLVGRILEFPGGYPGDAGLTLTWGS
ncbi:MAG: CBS domain-containing protein [Phyllobacteriaceae bacterium]|nr:CBS domain-containing protein [Phyllobacteriaceae bacterium]